MIHGKGIFDTLLKIGKDLGYTAETLVSKTAKNTIGKLTALGARLLTDHGLSGVKTGQPVHVGNGFFSDIGKFAKKAKKLGNLAEGEVSKLEKKAENLAKAEVSKLKKKGIEIGKEALKDAVSPEVILALSTGNVGLAAGLIATKVGAHSLTNGNGVNNSYSKNPNSTVADGRIRGKGSYSAHRNNPNNTGTDGSIRTMEMGGKGITTMKSFDRFYFGPNNNSSR